jgi:GAF domain-containing protein
MESTSSKNQPVNPQDSTRQLYKNWREGFALPLLIGVLVFGAVALVPAVIASDSILIDAIFITTYLITGLVTVTRFSYAVRMSVFLLSVFMLGVGELITHGILGDSLFFFLALIIFSTILFSPKAGIIATALNIVTFLLFGWLIQSGLVPTLNPNASPAKVEDWISAGAAMIMFGAVIILGFQRLEREFFEAQGQIDATLNELKMERNNLENKVQERTLQLRKINEVGRSVTAILDPDELLPRAVHLIENEFECYYTAFYFLDITGQWAEIREASGEAGRVLKENKHRLDLDGKSTIAKAIRTKTGQIALDTSSDQMRFDNPLLPYTHSQIALPLIVGDTILGALEMHSTKENAFSPQDVDAYQNMANGIAIAIENSRLFQESRQSLLEMNATQRQYLQSAWQSLPSDRDLEYALGDGDPASGNTIEVPLALRDQIIGQIQLAGSAEWTNEQKSLIEAIAAQATLALENARLVEESQSTAAQERLANEITSKIWASTNMDGILQTTVRELGRNLEATEVEIEISMDGKNDE